MSTTDFTHARRIAAGLGIAAGGAFAAALMGLGTAGVAGADPTDDAYVDTYYNDPALVTAGDVYTTNPIDAYDILFGASGTDVGGQGYENAAADLAAAQANLAGYESFTTDVISFEENNGHALADLIYSIDPSAFYLQTTEGITGTMAGGAYLVPDDMLGYLATGLDYGLLSPTGLGYVLDPLIDVLLGEPIG